MRLSTGDNYLFSFLSFPSSLLIKTSITLCMRIKFNPKEEECIYAKVTPGKQWMELGCSWWQLCQVAVGKKPSLIITAGYIILISCNFYIGLKELCLWETKADVMCPEKNVCRGKTYASSGQILQRSNLKLLRNGAMHYRIYSGRSRRTGLVAFWYDDTFFSNAPQSWGLRVRNTTSKSQGRKNSSCLAAQWHRYWNTLISFI